MELGAEGIVWQFFIAHGEPEREAAEQLYDLLSPDHRVFLDCRSLRPGDMWDLDLPRAVRASAVIVVLLSGRFELAYYLREEIAAAIHHSRERGARRVVPVLLEGWPAGRADLPYGLGIRTAIDARKVGGIPGIAAELRRLVAPGMGVPGDPGTPPPRGVSPHNLRRQPAERFVGRERALEQLHERLQAHDRVSIVAVSGMGGIGKTELAHQYAREHLSDYPGGVCWIDCRARGAGEQVVEFALVYLEPMRVPDLPSLEARVQYCWRNWPDGKVLVVLDDVSSWEVVAPWLPPSGPETERFRVLITTRRQQLGRGIAPLKIDLLTENAALELLQVLAGAAWVRADPEQARALCALLGYLPLALELAGRYMALVGVTVGEMAARLRRKGLEQEGLVGQEELGGPRGLAAAFDLSWEELRDKPVARELGCLLGLCGPAPIPWALVTDCMAEWEPEALEVARSLQLANLSLIAVGEDGECELHPLIRAFLRGKCEASEEGERLKRAVCRVLAARAEELPQDPTLGQLRAFAPLVPHLEAVATDLVGFLEDAALLGPFVGLGRFFQGQAMYWQAEPWLEQCISAIISRHGADHLDVGTSLTNLALLYRAQGRFWEAEPLYQQALSLSRQVLGEDHPDVARSLNNLAALYVALGRYGEAELLCQEAFALQRRVLEEDHPDAAMSLNNLALLYHVQGRYGDAEPLQKQALGISRRVLGEDHPDVAMSLNNLAGLYHAQGRYGDAEPLHAQALEIRRRVMGEDHPDVATSLNNLAGLYCAQGRYGEAEPLHEQALGIRRRVLGEDHPDVAVSLNNLATLYAAQGRYEDAEPLYRKALQILEPRLGPSHRLTRLVGKRLEHLQSRRPPTPAS